MIDITQYPVQVRANARLVDAGRKKIEQCPVPQQTEICVVLIANHDWKLEQIPQQHIEEVKKELAIVE